MERTKELFKDEYVVKKEIKDILNRKSVDNLCNTPDSIMAEYLIDCIMAYKKIHDANDNWHGNPYQKLQMTYSKMESLLSKLKELDIIKDWSYEYGVGNYIWEFNDKFLN